MKKILILSLTLVVLNCSQADQMPSAQEICHEVLKYTPSKEAVIEAAIKAKDATSTAAQEHPYIAAGVATGVATYSLYSLYTKRYIIAAALTAGAAYAIYKVGPQLIAK